MMYVTIYARKHAQLHKCVMYLHYKSIVSLNQSDHTGDSTHSHRWTSLELVKGTYTTDDSPSDIAEIRLDKVVPLKVNKRSARL